MIRRIARFIHGFLPHLLIVLSLFYITCFIVDRYNRAMAFVNNDFTKIGLLILCLAALFDGVWNIVERRRSEQTGEDRSPSKKETK